jgi:hypothetical protein
MAASRVQTRADFALPDRVTLLESDADVQDAAFTRVGATLDRIQWLLVTLLAGLVVNMGYTLVNR